MSRLIEAWLDAERRQASISPHDLTIAQYWLIDAWECAYSRTPRLISPAKVTHLYRRRVADPPLGEPPTDPPRQRERA